MGLLRRELRSQLLRPLLAVGEGGLEIVRPVDLDGKGLLQHDRAPAPAIHDARESVF